MIKAFKRSTAILTLALVIAIAITPCLVCFLANNNVQAAEESDSRPEGSIQLVTKTYKEDQILSAKQDDESFSRAQAFDLAIKATAKAVTELEEQKESGEAVLCATESKDFLLQIDNPDTSYVSYSVELSDYDRDVLEHLVMGEAGGQGFIGCALVAQAIKDTLITDGYPSVDAVRVGNGYSASLDNVPNQDVLDAIEFVFDNGGAAVQHRVIYFYAPNVCESAFHESQNYVVTHGGHKFFDRW
ncbi:MAG: cell wall hydrolase [Ruminococcaceae bacterium]|nr:cell wall hydrolase [Oscillospiraceae bacterium]